MKTIASCVQEIIISRPFLEEALAREIINFSALAKDLNSTISEMLRKPVKDGAIMMALRRYESPVNLDNAIRLKDVFKNLGDITVRSNLSDFTFQNSKTLIHSHLKVLEKIAGVSDSDISLKKKQAKIQYDPERTNINKLKEAIVGAGFEINI